MIRDQLVYLFWILNLEFLNHTPPCKSGPKAKEPGHGMDHPLTDGGWEEQEFMGVIGTLGRD